MSETFQVYRDENVLKKTEKFFFCISTENLAKTCCCGCSLKLGVQILSIFGIIGAVFSSVGFISNEGDTILFISIVFNIISLIGNIYLLKATLSKKANDAYTGYLCQLIVFSLTLIFFIIVLVIFFINSSLILKEFNHREITAFYIYLAYLFLINILIRFYYLWINFSFTRYLALGNWAIIEGFAITYDVGIISNNGTRNVIENPGYYQPPNPYQGFNSSNA
jgi:hypothetical protein